MGNMAISGMMGEGEGIQWQKGVMTA